jgi:hypothetical protein
LIVDVRVSNAGYHDVSLSVPAHLVVEENMLVKIFKSVGPAKCFEHFGAIAEETKKPFLVIVSALELEDFTVVLGYPIGALESSG